MTHYIYPQNLKATANMWLWSLRDFAIMGVTALISIVILVELHLMLPAAATLCFSQNITVNAPAGSTFMLSGWGKANALPDSVAQKSSDDQPYFGLVARIYYADGSSEPFYFSFDPYFSDWQERSGILMPSEANQNKAITSVTVVAAYDNNANTAYFDNISLRLEPSQTYRYDSNGNPVAATQPGTGSESASYSNSVDLTGYTAANGSKYTYTYNSAHDITSAKVGGLTATTTYNVNGNATGAKLTADGTNLYMETSSTPTPDRNHTETVTDANGYTTTYAYYSNGQLFLDNRIAQRKLFRRAALCYRQIGNGAYIENRLRCILEQTECLESFNAELTNKIVKQIRLSEDGSVRIILINEQEVRKEQTDHASSSPSNAT